MEIKYSQHLVFRMRVRQIPQEMPERIYWESQQRYYNHHTFRRVAVMQVHYRRRRSLMMIAYDQFAEYAEILTIHPITRNQIQDRIREGRWTYEQIDSEL